MNYKKIVLSFCIFAVFCGVFLLKPSNAKAITAEELRAQMDALLKQIEQLRAQLTEIEGKKPWCHNFVTNLGYGKRGAQVEALQIVLEKEGFTIPESEKEDKYFGDFTASAVVGFQEKYASEILAPWGLEHGTGYVGKTTRAKLNALYGCKAKPSITVLSPNGGETFTEGETLTIHWKSEGLPEDAKVYIMLYDYSRGGVNMDIVRSISASKNYYEWEIPINLKDLQDWAFGYLEGPSRAYATLTSDQVSTSDKYKVFIGTTWDNQNVFLSNDYSDNYFSIVEKPTPSIGVPSPNLGDVWQMGSTYNIIWFANNLVSSDKINIILLDGRAGYSYYVIATDVPALVPSGTYAGTPIGTYSWTVPMTGIIPSSTNPFKIYIGKYKPSAQSGDWEPLRASAESVLYGYGNNFSIVSTSAKPIINSISPNSILQGQTLQVTLYGYNLSGATTTSGSCGLNPEALGGFILGNCNIDPLAVSVSITAANNATPGQRQLTITTPSGTSNAVTFTVLSSSVNRSIKVLSPNGGENWQIGQTYRIKWDSQGVDKVAIYVYNDTIFGSGSTNYITPNGDSIENVGYYDWTISDKQIPGGSKDRYKISVSDSNYSSTKVRDDSDNYFSIVASAAERKDVFITNLTNYNYQNLISWNVDTKPAAGSVPSGATYYWIYKIKNISDYKVKLNYKAVNSLTGIDIPNSNLGSGAIVLIIGGTNSYYGLGSPVFIEKGKDHELHFSLTLSSSLKPEDVAIRITIEEATTPSITVLSPNGGETWTFGTPQTIKWTTSGIADGKTFGLYLMSPNGLMCHIATVNALDWTYTVTLQENQQCSNPYFPNLTAGQYKINIDAASATGIENSGDQSDNYFSIVEKPMECKKEGESIPVIPNAPSCCAGLTLIKPKDPGLIGTMGICTAKCGNGVCDTQTETTYNCPVDCKAVTCTDSDGGIEYYTKGIVYTEGPTTLGGLTTGTYNDLCWNNGPVLHEWYCGTDKTAYKKEYTCPNGCKDGACKLGVKLSPENPLSHEMRAGATTQPLAASSEISHLFLAFEIDNPSKKTVSIEELAVLLEGTAKISDFGQVVWTDAGGNGIGTTYFAKKDPTTAGYAKIPDPFGWVRGTPLLTIPPKSKQTIKVFAYINAGATEGATARFSMSSQDYFIKATGFNFGGFPIQGNTMTITKKTIPVQMQNQGTYEMPFSPGTYITGTVNLTNNSSEDAVLTEIAVGNPQASNDFLKYTDNTSYSVHYLDKSGATKISQLRDTLRTTATGYRIFNIVPTIVLPANSTVVYWVQGKLNATIPVNSFQIILNEFSGYGVVTYSPVKSSGTITVKINLSTGGAGYLEISNYLAAISETISKIMEELQK